MDTKYTKEDYEELLQDCTYKLLCRQVTNEEAKKLREKLAYAQMILERVGTDL
jgi:hypothetical protein